MIGNQIKELRQAQGMSQTELAKMLGVTRSSVNAWEMGTNVPTTQYLMDLAKAFRVSTDYLLGMEAQESLTLDGLQDEQKSILFSLIRYFNTVNGDAGGE